MPQPLAELPKSYNQQSSSRIRMMMVMMMMVVVVVATTARSAGDGSCSVGGGGGVGGRCFGGSRNTEVETLLVATATAKNLSIRV